MQNDKKDINAILASLDPKLREKIEIPMQKKTEEIHYTAEPQPAEQAEETAEAFAEEAADTASEAAEEIIEAAYEPPKSKLDEALAALDPKLRDAINGKSGEDEPVSDGLKEAENKAAAILAFEGSKAEGAKHKNGAAYLALELIILEIIAFILFFATFRSEEWGGVGLIAMLMPAIAGILMRMFKDQLSLRESVSKCKLHIILSCFFLVCVMLSA